MPLDITVGERLRIGATHWERRLFNGTIVTVEALEQRKQDSGGIRVLITGRTDTGRAVSFHHDEIRDYHGRIRLDHGYALTIASAQGLTADRVFLYADNKPARQTIYPAATRHRERLDFYLDRRPLVLDIIARAPEDAFALKAADDVILAYLGERWSRGAPKAAALDYPALPPQLRQRPEGEVRRRRARPLNHPRCARVSCCHARVPPRQRGARGAGRAGCLACCSGAAGSAGPTCCRSPTRSTGPIRSASSARCPNEAKALIAKGQRLLDTPDPARLAETAWLSKVGKATTNLEKTVRDDNDLHQSRQALNAKLEPYTEVICRHNLPHGVKRDGQWRVSTVRDGEEHTLTVQLSGAAKGTWEDKAANRRGDLLDIIRHTATDGDIIQAMDAARAFLEAQLRQQHKMAQDHEQKQTKHKSRGRGMSL